MSPFGWLFFTLGVIYIPVGTYIPLGTGEVPERRFVLLTLEEHIPQDMPGFGAGGSPKTEGAGLGQDRTPFRIKQTKQKRHAESTMASAAQEYGPAL